jgi:16S rRNA (guanine527-N7)-methyltransferase
MTPTEISHLIVPYAEQPRQETALSDAFLAQVSTYLDLLLRWNARTNLTAIRAPEEIITRHFGESLFAACHFFPDRSPREGNCSGTLADVGSGAGFPGLPIKLWAPQIHVTLIESHQKKATFLREAIRSLKLTDIEVQATRADHVTQTFDTVTLRAVERFDQVLPVAARLVRPGGRLALLIGEDQIPTAKALLPAFQWEDPRAIPLSQHRVLVIGS